MEFQEEDFTQIIENQKANRLGFTPYITYGHVDEEPNSTDSHRKRGELVQFSLDNDTLYGDFSVKEDTYELVKDGDYEYSSGEFIRNFTDKLTGSKVGTTFLRVALTNSPFIPFKEKVQALSQTQEEKDCTQTIEPFVFGLSINSVLEQNPDLQNEEEKTQLNDNSPMQIEQELTSTSNEEVKEEKLEKEEVVLNIADEKDEQVEPVAELETEVKLESVKSETTEQIPVNIKQEHKEPTMEKETESEKVEKTFDLAALVSQVDSLKNLYETKLEEANTTIGTLTTQISEMANKLTAQEQVTQAFSQNISKAQEHALYSKLAEAGVTPVVIQKFSVLKDALVASKLNQSTIKLSVSETEVKDESLIEAVADLLISSARVEPVQFQQFGVSARKTQSEAFSAGFEDIIKRNQELASKRNV